MSSDSLPLPFHPSLRAGSRLGRFAGDRPLAVDLLLLCGMGSLAAASTALVDFNLQIPGHALLRAVLPLALGLALVPRRGGGFIMSGAAGLTMLGLQTGGVGGAGPGALTSLLLTGPLLDAASHWSRRGWQIYLSFACAGLAANLGAYLVRWLTKAGSGGGGGGGLGGGRALGEWQAQALVTYAACGLLAGLIGAALCFRASWAPPSPQEALRP